MDKMSDKSIPEFAPFGYTLAIRMAQLIKGEVGRGGASCTPSASFPCLLFLLAAVRCNCWCQWLTPVGAQGDIQCDIYIGIY